MNILIAALAPLLSTAAANGGFSDADIAVLVQQALVSDARQQALSADQLGRSQNLRPDFDVARDVQLVLKARMPRGLSNLTVSCQAGEVVLMGRVDSDEDLKRAELLATAVPGVRKVVNRLQAPGAEQETIGAYKAPVDEGPATSAPFSFLTWDGMAARDVVVHVDKGVVSLRGTASSTAARDYATAAARLAPGARMVKNTMAVTKTNDTTDDRLGKLIQRRFEYDTDLQSNYRDIHVFVKQAVVTLTGTVRSDAQIDKAEFLAAGTRGVVVVNNQLTVTSRAAEVQSAR